MVSSFPSGGEDMAPLVFGGATAAAGWAAVRARGFGREGVRRAPLKNALCRPRPGGVAPDGCVARSRPPELCRPPRLAPPVRVEHAQRPAPRTTPRLLDRKDDRARVREGRGGPAIGEELDPWCTLTSQAVTEGSVVCCWFETPARGFVQRWQLLAPWLTLQHNSSVTL